jgi:thiol-disulfide isomerase/thioredoxin
MPRTALILFFSLATLIVVGCEADDPTSKTEYIAKSDGTPQELVQQLMRLEAQHKANKTDDPLLSSTDMSAYEQAVSKTCNAIINNAAAPPELKQKAGEFRVEVLEKQLESEPSDASLKRYLDALDEIEKLGQGSGLVPYAAHQRVMLLSKAPEHLFKDMPERIKRVGDAAEHLAGITPHHPQTAEILGRSARISEDNGDPERARKFLTLLVKEFPESPEGRFATGKLHRMEQKEQILEDFTGPDLDGKPVDLKQFRGKVVLVDFWATWCKPCAEEMPHLKQLRDHFQPKGFEILGVDLDETPIAAREFMANRELEWPQIFDGAPGPKSDRKPLAVRFGVSEIPYKLLIDREGRLIASSHSLADLQKPISKIFGEPIPGAKSEAKEAKPSEPQTKDAKEVTTKS